MPPAQLALATILQAHTRASDDEIIVAITYAEEEPDRYLIASDLRWRTLDIVQGQPLRWLVEQFYEDAKGECGLAHDQGRRWDGLHRHLALVMLVYSFLARQRWTPAPLAGFSPSGERPSFPAVHRQVLVWLFQYVVLWLIATNQTAQFRPRRI